MEGGSKPAGMPDWAAISRAREFGIPAEEIEQFAPVLDRLVSDCRKAFRRDLHLVEPIGTFRPDEGGAVAST